MKNELLLKLYQQPQTVFRLAEIAMLARRTPYPSLRRQLSYAVAKGRLRRPRQGVYAKKDFVFEELANKIYTPSYVSLQTVLRQAGLIFQEYRPLFLVSYLTRKIICQGQEICYQAVPSEILVNNMGVMTENGWAKAEPERAFLDMIFLHRDYHVDNLAPLDWEKVFNLVKIYQSPRLEKQVNDYYRQGKEE